MRRCSVGLVRAAKENLSTELIVSRKPPAVPANRMQRRIVSRSDTRSGLPTAFLRQRSLSLCREAQTIEKKGTLGASAFDRHPLIRALSVPRRTSARSTVPCRRIKAVGKRHRRRRRALERANRMGVPSTLYRPRTRRRQQGFQIFWSYTGGAHGYGRAATRRLVDLRTGSGSRPSISSPVSKHWLRELAKPLAADLCEVFVENRFRRRFEARELTKLLRENGYYCQQAKSRALLQRFMVAAFPSAASLYHEI